MRRLAAAVLALLILCSSALAAQDAPIASYGLPQGAEVFYLLEAAGLQAPAGLEAMYGLMRSSSAMTGDVYLIRMKNGRALASVSCVPVHQQLTAQQLADLWPRIAQSIELEGAAVDHQSASVQVETLYGGHEMLHIQVRLGLQDEGGTLWLDAEGYAFCRGEEVTECWAVCPQNDTYPGDCDEAAELSTDRRDLKLFLDSLSFPESWNETSMGVPFEDRDGRFVMAIPEDAVVIDVHSSAQEVDAARTRYIHANPAGAEQVFDCLMQDVYEERMVLIFTADMQGIIQVFAAQEEHFRGATPENLCKLALPVQQTLNDKFGFAACLANDERVEVSGVEHALLAYWLRCGELDLQLDIMGCVIEDDWLYEVDIYAAEGNQNLRTVLHSFVRQSMCYTPPQNGLSE